MQYSSSVEPERHVFFQRHIALDSLSSFTHNYPLPPLGYDDAAAGGGRTYFFRPLRFRCDGHAAQPSATPTPTLYSGARPEIATRRQGSRAPLFVYTDVNRHFTADLPATSATDSPATPTPPPSSGSPDSDVDSPYGRLATPLLERDEDFNGDPDDSSDDESDDDPYEWVDRNRRENSRVCPHWSSYAVTPAPRRQPVFFSGESPLTSLNVSSLQQHLNVPPVASAFKPTNEKIRHVRYEDDVVFRTRKIPHPDVLFLPGSYTDIPVIDPAAAQDAAEERWQNRKRGAARRHIDLTRLLARVLIACAANTILGPFLPGGFAVFWLNVLLIALVMS